MSPMTRSDLIEEKYDRARRRAVERRENAKQLYRDLQVKGLRVTYRTMGMNEWCFVHLDAKDLTWNGCATNRETATINAYNSAAADKFGAHIEVLK